jgi:hypothetical protein
LEHFKGKSSPSRFDLLLIVLLVGSNALTLLHKLMHGTTLFMLQPCHMSIFLLVAVLWQDKNTPSPHVLFNVYLNLMWGT